MVSGTGRRTIAVAGVLAAIAGGAVIARADDPRARCRAGRGRPRRLDGVNLERTARPAPSNDDDRRTGSKEALAVTVTPRPWTQSSSGVVSPNRRKHARPTSTSARHRSRSPRESEKKRHGHAQAASPRRATSTARSRSSASRPTSPSARASSPGYRILGALRFNATDSVYSAQGRRGEGLRQGLREEADARRHQHGQHDRADQRHRPAQEARLGTDRPDIKGVAHPAQARASGSTLASGSSLQAGIYRRPSRSFRRARQIATSRRRSRCAAERAGARRRGARRRAPRPCGARRSPAESRRRSSRAPA